MSMSADYIKESASVSIPPIGHTIIPLVSDIHLLTKSPRPSK